MYHAATAGIPSHAERPSAPRRELHQVIDRSMVNDEHNTNVIETYRNKVLADRLAKTNANYEVRSYLL